MDRLFADVFGSRFVSSLDWLLANSLCLNQVLFFYDLGR